MPDVRPDPAATLDPAVAAFAAKHPVGFLRMPPGFSHLPVLGASAGFMVPTSIDERGRCTPTEDQGANPWCAAYAAAQFAEHVMWRLTGRPQDVPVAPLYRYAKEHDGDPHGDGTTLTAVLQALKASVFTSPSCQVKVLRPSRLSVKFAVHKFGCALGGFNIDSSWWGATKTAPVIEGKGSPDQGGHAVLICGYDKQGVWIQNSWGKDWAEYGFAKIAWPAFDRQFIYGAVLSHVLDGMTVTT